MQYSVRSFNTVEDNVIQEEFHNSQIQCYEYFIKFKLLLKKQWIHEGVWSFVKLISHYIYSYILVDLTLIAVSKLSSPKSTTPLQLHEKPGVMYGLVPNLARSIKVDYREPRA